MLSHLHIGHCHLAHYYLLCGEDPSVCVFIICSLFVIIFLTFVAFISIIVHYLTTPLVWTLFLMSVSICIVFLAFYMVPLISFTLVAIL